MGMSTQDKRMGEQEGENVTGFVKKNLAQLFQGFPLAVLSPALIPETPITGVVFDSRAVQPGYLFVALQGGSVDGHRFIADAVGRGASAVVGMQAGLEPGVPYVQVVEPREALAYLSAAFYDYPARQMTVVGVTGTDGKTTTSNLIYHMLLAGRKWAGMISTVNAQIGSETLDTGFHVTTPEAPEVQRYLARMVSAGLTHVVLESTSHGLAQHRVSGCEFDVAVVTNITHEHLDYHGNYEAYRAAKARLFTSLSETSVKVQGNPRLAVLNCDDRSYSYLQAVTSARQVGYSLRADAGADLWAEDIHYDASGLHFWAVSRDFRVKIDSHLVGAFNIANILAGLCACIFGLGIAPEDAAEGVRQLAAIPGRMERIDLGQDFTAIVDFAHTPFALESALRAAREMTQGRVIAIFGSAGLRDRQKRRMMAEVSAQLADFTVLTAEDPRTESLDEILEEMAQAAREAGGVEGETFWRVADRRAALRAGVALARPGDVVMACGKGHEQSMCFGAVEYPWDDRTALRSALAEHLGVEGPSMPLLPEV